jgi:hypothetical protein
MTGLRKFVNDELEGMWKELVNISQHLPGETKENHDVSSVRIALSSWRYYALKCPNFEKRQFLNLDWNVFIFLTVLLVVLNGVLIIFAVRVFSQSVAFICPAAIC